jgi:hypothetical protein
VRLPEEAEHARARGGGEAEARLEIRLRAAMVASVDEGVGMLFAAFERDGKLDELYDLEKDPFELKNLSCTRGYARICSNLQKQLHRLVAAAAGL